MAIDKAVDSTQLNSDLTSVANAIRTKGGTSAQMAFPAGFVSAVQAIPTGTTPTGTKSISITENGTVTEDVAAYASAEISVNVQGGSGVTWDEIANRSFSGDVVTDATSISPYAFATSLITSISAPYATHGKQRIAVDGGANDQGFQFASCKNLKTAYLPLFAGTGTSLFNGSWIETAYVPLWNPTQRGFYQCDKLKQLCVPSATSLPQQLCTDCSSLTIADIGPNCTQFVGGYNPRVFYNCSSLKTIIFRRSSAVVTLSSMDSLEGTPFASGGAGGTIYIPQALYAHLGDGTALDYKAATNWATYDGYGTTTWAQIEGSIYETQYADGTLVT